MSDSSKNPDWIENGILFFNAGKYNEAIECYDKAIKLNPNSLVALYNKGSAVMQLGKYNEVIECYDKAIKLNPNSLVALYNKGLAVMQLGKYNEAD